MSSSTQPKTDPALKLSFLDYMDEGRLNDWLSEKGKYTLYAVTGVLVLFIVIFAFSRGSGRIAEKEYLQAATDFAFFAKTTEAQDSTLTNDAFQRLLTIMDKDPDLHAAYDGAIAQILLNRGRVSEAMPFAERTLERTKTDALSFYRDYASASLMISEGGFHEALQRAQSLQMVMAEIIAEQKSISPRTFGDEIFALNLLRIAMLQQAVGDKAGELQTWRQWKQYAGLQGGRRALDNVDPQAFRAIMQQLAVGAFSLPDYIDHREKVLGL